MDKIFIIPSKTGLGLVILILLLFLLGINFQNSLVYAVCFWLIALLLINIFYTQRNLSSLSVTAIGVEPCFAGEKAVVEIALSCPANQRKFALQLAWPGEDLVQVNLAATPAARIKLSHATTQRGRFQPPRIHISTRFPTGLALAWAYVTLDVQGIVYPKPVERIFAQQGKGSTDTAAGGVEIVGGTSDFGGIRAYRPGDAPKHIHWSKYAQTGKLHTKVFVDYSSHDVWLDWNDLPMPGVEVRLSHLCSKVLEYHQAQRQYGLKLPGKTIPPGKGEGHKAQCLRALALFGVKDE
ncbi:MAG: DUF58 domain-containing protein [Gammaproteobacteria bacterium]|nr:DUF58 domain-containing protein [Gammaproteobacteria bacterium]MBU1724888.1 DUF58 domain-containing protein [Gammaproteobacteria bacterium]MBU2004908.1 DUF58 domain-containing protein [Gammaproteobacteria bacterium]